MDHYSLPGNDISIRSTDPRFLELLAGYIGEHRMETGPDWPYLSADCGVEKSMAGGLSVRGHYRLYKGTMLVYGGRSMDEMAGRVISIARDLAAQDLQQFVQVRAGGIALGGDAVVLPSMPQPHLPALVGLAVRSGASYIGDEIVLVDPVLGRASGISLPLLLDSSDFGLFPELDREPVRSRRAADASAAEAMTPRRPVTLPELKGRRADPVDIRWIVFPEFELGGPTELMSIERSEALFRLSRSLLNLHVWGDRVLYLWKELREKATPMRLRVGSMEAAAEMLLSLPLAIGSSSDG
jgi:hypothetical protein